MGQVPSHAALLAEYGEVMLKNDIMIELKWIPARFVLESEGESG